MVKINNGKTRAAELIERNRKIASRAENIMTKNFALSSIPEVSNRMARNVSAERREMLEMQLEAGEFREQGSGFSGSRNNPDEIKQVQTTLGVVSHNGKSGLYKMANTGSVSSSGGGWRGPNDSVRQAPEVYSPLWLNSNLNLPRESLSNGNIYLISSGNNSASVFSIANLPSLTC